MLMLSTFGAMERSGEQFQALLERAGFTVEAPVHIAGAHYYIMASA